MRTPMSRRTLLRSFAAMPLVSSLSPPWRAAAPAAAAARSGARVRPGDPGWPTETDWERLNKAVGGQLIKVQSPLAACATAPDSAACAEVFKKLKNPYYLGDEVGLTQTLGWVDAWTLQPSVYAVAARTSSDVAAAVNFARERNLRVVIKGGGHSYLARPTRPTPF
jgi:hypothetical protein